MIVLYKYFYINVYIGALYKWC